MAGAAEQAYAAGRKKLEELWVALDVGEASLDQGLAGKVTFVVKGRGSAQRYAIINQLLVKLVLPEFDPHELKSLPDAAGRASPRSFARQVVAPFDLEHGAPLGGSTDPYVSQPLRRAWLDESLAVGPGAPLWQALLDVLKAVEGDPTLVEPALLVALRAMRERKLNLRSLITRVLELQAGELDADGIAERGELVKAVAPQLLRPKLPPVLQAQGGGGVGRTADVPWFRVFSPEHSPSAQAGWYVAYLFSVDGKFAYLCLTQGVSAPSVEETEEQAQAARQRFSARDDLEEKIDLRSGKASGRPWLYERATALAKSYPADALPPLATLEADLASMLELLIELYEGEPKDDLVEDLSALTVDDVLAAAEQDGIELDIGLARSAVAAIRAGQHVLLTGPPGTGKTSFAVALARAAAGARLSQGFELVTSTADWTSAETIGAYWPDPEGKTLKFEPGPVLRAIDKRAWLVIDEFNRADIDKAFGPLFTVLSGHSVRLALHEELDGDHLPVEILPAGQEPAGDTAPHEVGKQWRLIATLNTRDRDLLFSLSYALLRRFAVIDVPVPRPAEYEEILKARAASGDDLVDERLAKLASLPHRQLGPAILIDCGTYLYERLQLGEDDEPDELLAEAISAFVLPQLDDLSRPQQADVVRYLAEHVLVGWEAKEVAGLLATTFQAPVQSLVDAVNADKDQADIEDELGE